MKRINRGMIIDAILGLLVLAVIAGALSFHRVRQQVKQTVHAAVTEPTPSATPMPPKLYKATEVASAGVYSLQVASVRADTQGKWPYVPAKGFVYYMVDVKLKNTGHDPLEVKPAAQIYVRDSRGTTYVPVNGPVDMQFKDNTVAPGAELDGQVSFLVSQTRTGLRFTFDPDPVAAPPVTFDMGY